MKTILPRGMSDGVKVGVGRGVEVGGRIVDVAATAAARAAVAVTIVDVGAMTVRAAIVVVPTMTVGGCAVTGWSKFLFSRPMPTTIKSNPATTLTMIA